MALEKECFDKIDILELVDGDKPLSALASHTLLHYCFELLVIMFRVLNAVEYQ